ncbi:hypothetical protein CCS77_0777 [Campylobacter concisus]|uniref:Uncharacterized protein n=1 Tax=Campylobacter concisus TaxID=199 RepID=A0A2R4NZI6_9BACT|nr:hypothetical protein CCS77_0777 [Campylobacter concisus]
MAITTEISGCFFSILASFQTNLATSSCRKTFHTFKFQNTYPNIKYLKIKNLR